MKGIYSNTNYFKKTTTPNVIVFGSPIITDGIISNFTTENYTELPFDFSPTIHSWEMVWAFTTGSDVTTTQYIYNQYNNINITIKEQKLRVALGTGTSWDILGNTDIATATANTTYIIRLLFTGKTYEVFLDGILCYTLADTTTIGTTIGNIGIASGKSNPFLGSIDLSNSYIKIRREFVWHGTTLLPATKDDYDYVQYGSVYQVIKQVTPHYYKSTGELNNLTITGSPTVSAGVISNFSTANYLTMKVFPHNVHSFKIHTKITTSGNIGTNQQIFSFSATGYHTPVIWLNATGSVSSGISRSGTAWDAIINTNNTSGVLQSNTTYIIDVQWINDKMSGTLKDLEGNTYDFEVQSGYVDTIDNIVWTEAFNIGVAKNGSPFQGAIDLNETYIIINDKLWWAGTRLEKFEAGGINGIEVGNLTVINGEVSNFAAGNYVQLDKIPPTINSLEMQFKFTTSSSLSTAQSLFGQSLTNVHCPQGGINTSGYMNLYVSDNGSSWVGSLITNSALITNTTYYFKLRWSSSTQTLVGTVEDLNGNVIDMSPNGSYSDSISSIYWIEDLRIGQDLGSAPFLGSIDFNESYIKINGNMWWQGIAGKDDYDVDIEISSYEAVNSYEKGQYLPTAQPEPVKVIAWTQPTLSANGTLGGNAFAVSASAQYSTTYYAYKAFDGNTSTMWIPAKGSPAGQYLIMYNPDPICIKALRITNRDYAGCAITSGLIQASNHNGNWITLRAFTNSTTAKGSNWTIYMAENMQFFKYYRLYVSAGGYSSSYLFGVAEVRATNALQQV